MKRRKRRRDALCATWLASLMLWAVALSGCGSTAPDQPLLAGPGTTPVPGSPTQGSGEAVAAIQVVDSQTSLTAYPGGYMTLAITTSPFAVTSFVVNYGLSQPSRDPGIAPRTADAKGGADWRWQVELGAHSGQWPLTISALLPNGSRTTRQLTATVTLAPVSLVTSQSTLSAFPNGTMTLTIATAPQVSCILLLTYGPGTKTVKSRADATGRAVLSWRVDSKATAGTWPQSLTVRQLDGESTTATVSTTVL
jgi:hypothetical protein